MSWVYDHLPKEIRSFKCRDIILIVNSTICPQQKLRPCKEARIYCLGEEKSCVNNNCHNKLNSKG